MDQLTFAADDNDDFLEKNTYKNGRSQKVEILNRLCLRSVNLLVQLRDWRQLVHCKYKSGRKPVWIQRRNNN